MEGVIGYTTLFAGNFAPKNWAMCQGQIINIASNTALFSILGTVYGGNGTTTFGLPNLQGRAVVGVGTGPGLSQYSLGQNGGTESISVSLNQMPMHVHPVTYTTTLGAGTNATASSPSAATYSADNGGVNLPYASPADTALKPYPGNITMANAGSGPSPISSMNPFLALNYIVCLYGVYPARN
jgi:microcystin-dependent protein